MIRADERPSAVDTNVERAVPSFGVNDIEASLRFYIDGLGFALKNTWVPDGKLRWCWIERGGAALMLQEFWREGHHANVPTTRVGVGVAINFICKDALAIFRDVTARGIEAQRPFVGNRMWVTKIVDPDGYTLFFESPTEAAEETEYDGS